MHNTSLDFFSSSLLNFNIHNIIVLHLNNKLPLLIKIIRDMNLEILGYGGYIPEYGNGYGGYDDMYANYDYSGYDGYENMGYAMPGKPRNGPQGPRQFQRHQPY